MTNAANNTTAFKHNSVLISIACVLFTLMTVSSWIILGLIEKTGDVYVSKRPYPPYLYMNDFTQFYSIGHLAGSNERSKIYDPQTQDRYMNGAISQFGLRTQKIVFGQNVPWFFCVMIPFSQLPLRMSYWLFLALGAAFGTCGLVLILRQLRQLSLPLTAFVLLAINAALPTWFAYNHGNTSFYLAGWACLYVWSLLKQNDVLGGVALALVAQKPQYAIPLAIPALRYQRRKLILVAAIVEILLWIGAAWQLGAANVINYPHILFSTDTNNKLDGMYPLQMVSVRAIFAAFISEKSSMTLACGTFLIGLALLFYLWTKVKFEKQEQVQWLMALTIMSMLVISPHTSLYDVFLLCLPAALTLPLSMTTAKAAFAKCWFWLLVTYPVTSWFLYVIEDPQVPFQHRYLSFFNVCLLTVLIAAYFQLFSRSSRLHAQNDSAPASP